MSLVLVLSRLSSTICVLSIFYQPCFVLQPPHAEPTHATACAIPAPARQSFGEPQKRLDMRHALFECGGYDVAELANPRLFSSCVSYKARCKGDRTVHKVVYISRSIDNNREVFDLACLILCDDYGTLGANYRSTC
jgi:hypothetical protein